MNMGNETMEFWTVQAPVVWDTICEKGYSVVKRSYVEKKYQECAWSFLEAYHFMSEVLAHKVKKPEGAESPIWVFRDKRWAVPFGESVLMNLEIPASEVVLFDLRKWSSVLNGDYIGTENEILKFQNKAKTQGVKDLSQIIRTPFYPLLRQEINRSWQHIFEIEEVEEYNLQGAVWQIDKKWIKKVEKINTFI